MFKGSISKFHQAKFLLLRKQYRNIGKSLPIQTEVQLVSLAVDKHCSNLLMGKTKPLHLFNMSLFLLFLKVHGIIRRSSSFNTGRISHLYANVKTHAMGGGYIYIRL